MSFYCSFSLGVTSSQDEAGCSRVSRDDKRVACALFSEPVEARGSKMIEVECSSKCKIIPGVL
ncbi:hypothetical protein J1N35_016373 [Gossypium stocksii]|uniref:Uncharacterized protein n=1 Tax=Gossypium stocksii TaxID=47602 RepID=A0A9D3VK86_9ROSI|nr:hypothetical protein J1N35_016373 [Gossypium stocksii]